MLRKTVYIAILIVLVFVFVKISSSKLERDQNQTVATSAEPATQHHPATRAVVDFGTWNSEDWFSARWSVDHRHIACVEKAGSKFVVRLDGTPGPEYDGVGTARSGGGVYVVGVEHKSGIPGPAYAEMSGIVFAPTGGRFAYAAGRGAARFVVVDGKEQESFDGIGPFIFFSPDGSHVAYTARRGNECFAVVDGKSGPAFDSIEDSSFEFGPNATQNSYEISRNGKHALVVDGTQSPFYNQIGNLHWSSDGKHFAYVVHEANRAFVVLDGKPGTTFDDIDEGGSIISIGARQEVESITATYGLCLQQDGTLWIVAKKGDKKNVFADNRSIGEYDDVGVFGSLLVSNNDFTRCCFVAKLGGKQFVVIDGKAESNYDEVGGPIFSKDGKHIAYPAQTRGKWMVVTDGMAGPAVDAEKVFVGPIFSPDGKHVAYAASRSGEKVVIVVDGVPSPEYDGIGRSGIVFSGNSNHMTYLAWHGKDPLAVVDGKEFPDCKNAIPILGATGENPIYISSSGDNQQSVVRGGTHGPTYRSISNLVASEDNQHFAYVGHSEGKDCVVVDGIASEPFDSIAAFGPGPTIAADGTVEYFAGRNGHLFYIHESPEN